MQAGKKWNIGFTLVVSILLSSPISSIAANSQTPSWIIPDNVRIVQQDHTDGVKSFPSISAAVTSLGTPTSRSLIKIMPGTYTDNVTLPNNIDLVGSGEEGTIITSTSGTVLTTSTGSNTVEKLTITSTGNYEAVDIPANGTATLRNTVINVSTTGYNPAIYAHAGTALNFINSKLVQNGNIESLGMELQGNSFIMENCTVTGTLSVGSPFVIDSGVTDMKIINRSFDLKYTGTGSVTAFGASSTTKLLVSNSRIVIDNGTGGRFSGLTIKSECEIRDSYIEVKGGNALAQSAIDVNSGNLNLINSTVVSGYDGIRNGSKVTVANSNVSATANGIAGSQDLTVTNSVVSGGTAGITKTTGESFKIGNSQLIGGYTGAETGIDKVFNCYDAVFASVPSP